MESCHLEDYKTLILFVAYSLIEFYLGRTNKVKSNSVLELIARFIFNFVVGGKKP